MTFNLYKDRIGAYRWRLKSVNGKIIADSAEGYVNKSGAISGINLVKEYARYATIEDET